MDENQPYAVLGIHDEKVNTVDGSLARVRMFVDGQMVDEDFELPHIITVEEQIDTAVTARIAEIKKNGVEAKSDIVPEQKEQIVEDNPNE